MRILFISSGDEKYGAPKSMMELVDNLKERYDIEPIMITCIEGKISKWCKEKGIECYVLGQASFMVVGGSNWFRKIVKHSMYPYLRYRYLKDNKKARKRIEELLAGKQIDIVHTNVNRVDIGAYFAISHQIPHVWHLREFGKEDYNCMYLRSNAIQFMNRTATKFIAVSEAVKRGWAGKCLDEKKIEVIYNGIDLSRFPKKLPKRVNEHHDVVKVIFVGIICETKGQVQLIKAIETMPDEDRKRLHIDFYGGGRKAYINRLKKYVFNRGLRKFIEFKGYCSDIPNVLPEYDMGIISSCAEAFGRVTAEYMAAGLCVIASDTGANPEIVEHKKTGLIYKYNDIRGLVDSITYLLNHSNEMSRIRENAFVYAMERFSMNRCADNIYNLYKSVL